MAREDLEVLVRANVEQLSNDLAKGAAQIRAFAKRMEAESPKGGAFTGMLAGKIDTSGIRAAAAETRSWASTAKDLAVSSAKIATGFVAAELAMLGFRGVMGEIRESINLAGELEKNRMGFEVMLGSAQRAAEMVDNLREFAAKTPFNSREVIESARKLKAYGVEAEQFIPASTIL